MITEGPSRTALGRHVVNVVIGGSKTDCPNEEYIKKVFLIEGHQQKKAKPPNNVITFSDEDYRQLNSKHVDALVIKLDIIDQDIMKILVDNGSSVDILYYHNYRRMLLDKYKIEPYKELPLYGFRSN